MCLNRARAELIVVPVPRVTEEIAAAIQPVLQGGEQDAEQIMHIPVSQMLQWHGATG